MKKTLKNSEMFLMQSQLEPLLSQRGKLGYAVARNYRILSTSLTEYSRVRNELIKKYGEEVRDENGTPQIRLPITSPNFQKFCDDLAPINEIEHEVELMMVASENVIDSLTAAEILSIDWMIED